MQNHAPSSRSSFASACQLRATVCRSTSVTVCVSSTPCIGVMVFWVLPSLLYLMRCCRSLALCSIFPPSVPTRSDDSKSMSSPSSLTPVMLLHAITSVCTACGASRSASSKAMRLLW